jgi:hypothetical protein
MNKPVNIASRFDLEAFDALLGPRGFVSVLERHPGSGHVHYAAISRDSFDNGARLRITASYAVGFPGRGRKLYNLLTLDLSVHNGVASVICARRLGRLAMAAPLADALMALVPLVASSRLPSREQLTPFMPAEMLDALESDFTAADFSSEGIDVEEKLPEQLWDTPDVFHNGKIDRTAFAISLNLALGERAELVDVNPATGDYRVFHVGIVTAPAGETLMFELHRQGPGFTRRVFNVLSLTLGHADADGLSTVEAFTCDAGARMDDLPSMLPMLARIISDLQQRKRPQDTLLLPFLSDVSQKLWAQKLPEGVVS